MTLVARGVRLEDLRGSGNRLAWTSDTPLPAAPSTGRDVYFITARGYDRSGGPVTLSIVTVTATVGGAGAVWPPAEARSSR